VLHGIEATAEVDELLATSVLRKVLGKRREGLFCLCLCSAIAAQRRYAID